MRILLTNTTLAHRTGSELYVVELARALQGRGHQPLAYSPVLGDLARELAATGVPVVSDLAALDPLGRPPDLIHGHHHVETLTALLHFPAVPGLFVCHGYQPWEEAPLLFPRLLRYVAVDLPTAERLTHAGVPPERVETILNFVDLSRFRPRSALPPYPRRALVFSNNAQERTHLPVIRAACADLGIEVDVAGLASGQVADRPEELLPGYPLVFAKARAAIEALAVGAAVVLCDAAGCGPMVTDAEFGRLRRLNFGFRTLDQPLSVTALQTQIARYAPLDAARVSARLRAEAGLEAAVERYLDLYRRILDEQQASAATRDGLTESRAAAAYLRWLDPYLKERGRALIDREELWRRVHALEEECRRLRESGNT
jgi:hypothetical protein